MKNVKRDESSPVETIEGRLKRLRMNEIDARKRHRLREEQGVGGRENKGNLEGETPVERMQMLRTSRMGTQLRTPAPRRKRVGD